MRVVLFMRRPRHARNFSVEHLVESFASKLGPEFEVVRAVSRFPSNGIVRRLYNLLEAALRQGDVNHVTGDVNYLACALRPSTTVLTVLDCGPLTGSLTLRKRAIRLLWYALPVRRAACVTVISQAVKTDLLRHVRVDPAKVRVVYVAVPAEYRAIPRAFDALRPTILQVGTGPNKNLPRLIEALSGLACRLHIVGALTAEQRALLARHAIEYRSFSQLSNAQMVERYAECDIVAFASTFEGFGMPIVEGNIVGRPVLTGDRGSMPEVAGDAACIVDPYSVAAIRDGILRIARDASYREQLVSNGFRNARRFEAAAIARAHEAIYRELASPRLQRAR